MLLPFALFAAVITSLNDLSASFLTDNPSSRTEFCITGTVSYVIGYNGNQCHLLLNDGEVGTYATGTISRCPPGTGDVVRLTGALVPRGAGTVQPVFDSIVILGHRPVEACRQGSPAEIMSGRHDFHRAFLVGEVRGVEPSGTGPGWSYVSLISEDQLYYVPIPIRGASLSQLEALIGSTVRLDGYPDSHNCSLRFIDERRFMVADLAHIAVLSASPQDPFANAPSIHKLHRLAPEQISRLGRHQARGVVLTVWQGQNALLRIDDGRTVQISLASTVKLTRGQTVSVVGYPSTDGFMLRLSNALTRPLANRPFAEPDVCELSAQSISERLANAWTPKTRLQGQRIRLTGIASDLSEALRKRSLFTLSVAGHQLDVDFSSQPGILSDLVQGCQVEVTGTCVLTTENWAAISENQRLNGIRLVLDLSDDLKILDYPSWWTPTRLTAIIVILLLVLVGCLVWNRLLQRLSEKRGRELFRERSASALAELRTEERTRLAVELHDSISQTLTGAAMQLDAGEVGTAKRILASCRRELRSCLWELRSRAMDAADFADAVRETIEPHLGGRQASVDFDIPASSLSEELRHTALRIIREATVNAVRHGRASLIAISGELSGSRLSFSIVDNGRGFDPSVSQGSATGHFGLLGMRERAKAFNGSVNIISAPENGTEISVVLEDRDGYDFGEDPADKGTHNT